MVKREVLQAVRQKKFHIYQVSTVEQGIEILTGVSAGKPDKDGNYPQRSVYGAVQRKLKRYQESLHKIKKEFGAIDLY